MVTRKPVPSNLGAPPASWSDQPPPYRAPPGLPSNSESDRMHPGYGRRDTGFTNGTHTRSRSNSDASTDGWNSGPDEEEGNTHDQLPESLIDLSDGQTGGQEELPASLKVGNVAAASHDNRPWNERQNPWGGSEQGQEQSPGPPLHPQSNPHIRTQKTGQAPYGVESSQAAWGEAPAHLPPPPPTAAPPPPPMSPPPPPPLQTTFEEMASLSIINEKSRPVDIPVKSSTLDPISADVTGLSHGSQHSHSSNPWQEDLDREQQRRDEEQRAAHHPVPSLLDLDDGLAPPKPSRTPITQEEQAPPKPPRAPPRSPSAMEDQAPAKPPRPAPLVMSPAHSRTASANLGTETPTSQARRQRNENYQIKHINWLDGNGTGRGRTLHRSPILTQNANGPCPLLALVNALILSTPQGSDTALLDALRSRDQVSLGLLLDAVFEELVRKSETSGHDLPDIGDLYSFLITLHTGMNVNPKFVASSSPQRGFLEAGQVAMEDVDPAFRSQIQPGTFEETREMRLYSAFDIPLIHGWTVPPDSATYAAFDRSAPTFEEGQNIQFLEEDLEHKLQTAGLSSEEQQLFEDVTSIKQFFTNFPTQLTDFGLEVISKALRPGQIAILFRNDHFSTLYKEPKSGALMTLVTDTGYSSHDEIVWESLVDVNGAASELYSGDFRPVGSTTSIGPAPVASTSPDASPAYAGGPDGWQTVQSRKPRTQRNFTSPPTIAVEPAPLLHDSAGPTRKTREQEDHDLALALQLQEEEESNSREVEDRRRREEDLSRQFFDREQPQPQSPPYERPPNIPPRRSTRSTSTPMTPTRTRRPPDVAVRPTDGADDAPPPTYEEAASDRPYRPSGSTSYPHQTRQGDALGALGALTAQRQQSAFAAQSSTSVNTLSPGPGPNYRRRSSGQPTSPAGNRVRRQQSQNMAAPVYSGRAPGAPQGQVAGVSGTSVPEQEEKCVVM